MTTVASKPRCRYHREIQHKAPRQSNSTKQMNSKLVHSQVKQKEAAG